MQDAYEKRISTEIEKNQKVVQSFNLIIAEKEEENKTAQKRVPKEELEKLLSELKTVKEARDALLSDVAAWNEKYLKTKETSAEKKREAKYLLEMTHKNWKTDIADCHGKYESLL